MELIVLISGWLAVALTAVHASSSLAVRMEAVARACHELRGPITAARLGLELGIRAGDLSAARLRAIELELGRACLALDDLARVPSRGSMSRPPAEVDLRQLLEDGVEGWRATAESAGTELSLRWSGGEPYVRGDRIRLAQAAGNLISNAIEHGAGAVDVRGQSDGARVRIEVVDRGPGLPAPVAVLAARARAGRGERGRGLAIACAIAQAHGGRLAAAPSERGARLVLELPASVSARSAAPAPSGEPS